MGKARVEKERLTVRMTPGLNEKIRALKTVTHASTSGEVLKNALLFYDALISEQAKGNDVYVISSDGEKTKYPVFL